MKKADEVKKGLWCCSQDDECGICPYANGECHNNKVKADALAYIQQLEAGLAQWEDVAASPGAVEDMARENYRLTQELAAVKRERDALYCDLSTREDACDVCKHGCLYKYDCEELFGENGCSFEWRGVCPENTGD